MDLNIVKNVSKIVFYVKTLTHALNVFQIIFILIKQINVKIKQLIIMVLWQIYRDLLVILHKRWQLFIYQQV
jgi:hypothetical protein